MLGHIYYHGMLSKYVAIFGNLFNDIKIERFDGSKNKAQTFKVPIGYGPREKFMARVEEDPNLDRPQALSYPRMAFQLETFEYDGSRKLMSTQSIHQKLVADDKSVTERVMAPVPYNFVFKVWILGKNPEDAHKVAESIVPFFTPELAVTAHLLEDLPDYSLDIPIVLTSSVPVDDYAHDFKERRTAGWEMTFTLKGYLFGPVSKSKVIKLAKVNFYVNGEEDTKVDERLTVQPGLTADGQPTTDITQTIPYQQIEADDNYGYIVTIEDDI